MNYGSNMIVNSQWNSSNDAIFTFKTDGSKLLQSNNGFELNNPANTIVLKINHIIFQVVGFNFILSHVKVIVIDYLLMLSFEK